MPRPDPLACLLAAFDLAEEAPRDADGLLTDDGKALVQAALDQGKIPDDSDPEPVVESRAPADPDADYRRTLKLLEGDR